MFAGEEFFQEGRSLIVKSLELGAKASLTHSLAHAGLGKQQGE